ncbi:MAG: HlyD family efflux transporter periplasmic adaptor subunit [Patescibacteria group bacterium]|nr:HlyD family efflux transporter periplasmic adaptor subunit [Patescibacteria group bacterium]
MNTNNTETAPELLKDLRRRLMIFGGGAILILAAAGVASYLILSSGQVAIDTASVSAPLINLSSTAPGRLNAVYVNEGDRLPANAPVALVGTEVLKTKAPGLIVQANDTIGAQVAPGQTIVEMIDPTQLRVVGRIDETKGLAQIRIGDPITFTVDAFGSRTFSGVIDEIAPTSNQSGIVFNISDQRQTQQFDVKARFDTSAYPELRNGMSARMWIYTR